MARSKQSMTVPKQGGTEQSQQGPQYDNAMGGAKSTGVEEQPANTKTRSATARTNAAKNNTASTKTAAKPTSRKQSGKAKPGNDEEDKRKLVLS